MPLKRCTENGKPGWKWGNTNKCFTGKDAKKRAIKMGIAIEGPDKFAQKANAFEEPLTNEEIKYVSELMYDDGYNLVDIVATTSVLANVRKEKG